LGGIESSILEGKISGEVNPAEYTAETASYQITGRDSTINTSTIEGSVFSRITFTHNLLSLLCQFERIKGREARGKIFRILFHFICPLTFILSPDGEREG